MEMNWDKQVGTLCVEFRPDRAAEVKVLLPEEWAEGLRYEDGTSFVNGSVLKLDHVVRMQR